MNEIFKSLRNARNIVVLTGAGVSTDSGIPDFKTMDDSWNEKITRQEALSLKFFQKDPESFWRIFESTFVSKKESQPSSFHVFLKELELTKNVHIITQNVDNLHQKAGSSHVISVHGDMTTARCSRLSCDYEKTSIEIINTKNYRCDKCGKYLRPNIVLFDENVTLYTKAKQILENNNADIFLIVGTSLDVYPISELPYIAEYNGIKTFWVNKDRSPIEKYVFNGVFKGEIKDFVKGFKGNYDCT